MQPPNNPQNKGNKGQPTRTIQRNRAEDYVHVYANSVEVGISNWDLRLAFGEIVEADERKVVLEQRATVIMSPQHAKVFVGLLVQNVAAYEQQFGEIIIKGSPTTIEVEMQPAPQVI